MRQQLRIRLVVASLAVATLAVAVLVGSSPASAATPGPTYYLALGGSGSVGVQPTPADPRGQPTDEGYANDVVSAAQSMWPGLQLVQLGCPGETTITFIDGDDSCRHGETSQLQEALSFLAAHRNTTLVTLDLGFNDVHPCLRGLTVDDGCLDRALAGLRARLDEIVTKIRSAAGPDVRIVGVEHYDPLLGAWDRSHQFASASLHPLDRLNAVLEDIYSDNGVAVADVASAFEMGELQSSQVSGWGSVPRDVARVCELTWECAPRPYGPNQHPNDKGYALIAQSIMAALHRN
jgi:lysophospholipase L1-like esterase